MINESDFESPGYEYMRTYQNMRHLYHKLVALNYQRDFCHVYKCPPIHKYYFSNQSRNAGEQQFLFTCLCAWLIKDKCQMNLEIDPEEYEDPSVVIGVIIEALRLLLTPDDDSRKSTKNLISFPPGRLKQGFGPEVIWTMSILADRALEMMLDNQLDDNKIKITYHNSASNLDPKSQRTGLNSNSITIGQPFVGGGLTTRPLGSYLVDDSSLLFEEETSIQRLAIRENKLGVESDQVQPEEWYLRVERVRQILESDFLNDKCDRSEDWQNFLNFTLESKKSVLEFVNQTQTLMETIAGRIDRHLQVINTREKFLQINLKAQIDEFLEIWQSYSIELARNKNLVDQVTQKTDKFADDNGKLRRINAHIETRTLELNDGSKLRELDSMISKLEEENQDFNVKIGLLLTVYSKLQAKIVSDLDQ